jgi:aminopeptidase N
VNTLTPDFGVDDDGRFSSFSVGQTAHPDFPTLRRHRIGIGLYDDVDGRLVRRTFVETDIRGERSEITELVGQKQPDLVLLNDGDLTYAKIRLDERSLATVVSSIDTLDDSLARALCWGAAWDMTRDAEMTTSDFVTLVLRGVGTETDLTAVGALLRYTQQAIDTYSAPAKRDDLRTTWEQGLRLLVNAAEKGSDHQLALTRAFAKAAHGDEGLTLVEALLDGGVALDGLTVDTDLRWTLLTALAASGRVDRSAVLSELERDKTISGQEHAAAAMTVIPTAEAKQEAWDKAVVRDDVANETQRSIASAFQVAGQDDLLRPYVQKYLDVASTVWEDKGVQRATVALVFLFPRAIATQETLDTVDAWLKASDANPAAKRYVEEGRADIARALAAQAKDAG